MYLCSAKRMRFPGEQGSSVPCGTAGGVHGTEGRPQKMLTLLLICLLPDQDIEEEEAAQFFNQGDQAIGTFRDGNETVSLGPQA
ncbi:hypothetical protein H920_11011 [Fukomys damarensis]|uniref:Uncharacterized protein n=1 Tax=Fukomys damarensis TaxID=885580 RepID=A0A091DBG1_FUKDA|nr:hypothetical protein H920_11011 [Fukomys damarensis]